MNEFNPRYKQMILDAMNYHFPQARIILFGSRARGDNKDISDVDLAIDNEGKKIGLDEMWRARVTLDHLPIALKVDLVDFNLINQLLKEEIIREGKVWKS